MVDVKGRKKTASPATVQRKGRPNASSCPVDPFFSLGGRSWGGIRSPVRGGIRVDCHTQGGFPGDGADPVDADAQGLAFYAGDSAPWSYANSQGNPELPQQPREEPQELGEEAEREVR